MKIKLTNLIAKGKTEKVIHILLSATSKPKYKKSNNEISIISSQYIEYIRNKRLGLISPDDQSRMLARINQSLIKIIDSPELEHIDINITEIIKIEESSNSKKRYLTLSLIVSAMAIIAAISYLKTKASKPQGVNQKENVVSDANTTNQDTFITTIQKEEQKPSFTKSTPVLKPNLTKETTTPIDTSSFIKPSSIHTKSKREFIEITSKQFKPFKIAKYEVTVKQYLLFCKETNYEFPENVDTTKKQHPITYVSWDDAIAYCKYIGGRLPTVAEWEFAASGGDQSQHLNYNDKRIADKMAWYGNKHGLKNIGLKEKNELGLFDMIGNVSEWCYDTDEQKTTYRKIKGGGWKDYRSQLNVSQTSSERLTFKNSSTGLRIVFD